MQLALLFRPTDSHCIHVDRKASDMIQMTVKNVVKCYKEKFPESNIFIAKWPTAVFWGHMSVLDADLICLRELLSSDSRWKFFFNPAASELPFKSHQEIRRKFRGANGNIVNLWRGNKWRQIQCWQLRRKSGLGEFDMNIEAKDDCRKEPFPFQITIMKGYKNVGLTRNFTYFALENPLAVMYYNWLEDSLVPDEHFFPTMIKWNVTRIKPEKDDLFSVQKPDEEDALGQLQLPIVDLTQFSDEKWQLARTGIEERFRLETIQYFNKTRRSNWLNGVCLRESLWQELYRDCHGEHIRTICNFAVDDLPRARRGNCLFGNKFNMDVDTAAIFCQIKETVRLTTIDREREKMMNGTDD